MPQLSLYIDDETYEVIESKARSEHTSLSAWVRKEITRNQNKPWPEGYENVLGSLKGVDIKRPRQISFLHDSKREKL